MFKKTFACFISPLAQFSQQNFMCSLEILITMYWIKLDTVCIFVVVVLDLFRFSS